MLSPGTVLRDTYTVISLLGEGAFGEVYEVRHRYMGLQAMKLFKPGTYIEAEEAIREGFLLSQLGSANVIRVYDANEVDTPGGKRTYITMELATGGTLAHYLFTHPPPPVPLCLEFGRQICTGLAGAHSRNPPVLHRDVKPQNILLMTAPGCDGVPQLKLSDWGLARMVDPALRLASAQGTLLYMPPEGLLHYELAASDVYSAGIVFYQILTGKFPFSPVSTESGASRRTGLAETRAQLPPPPSSLRQAIPPSVDDACLKALEPDHHRRFKTAREFLDALLACEAAPAGAGA